MRFLTLGIIAMAYRPDPDLQFLSRCSDSDLNDLVYCLTHDKDGEVRFTEELTMSDIYKKFYPRHSMYWENIAAELQCFGANSVMTIFRGGKGVLYKEILCDVCTKMKVKFDKESDVITIEQQLLEKFLANALERMSPTEITDLAKSIGLNDTTNITKQVLLGSVQALFRAGGFKSYQATLMLTNAILKAIVGRGLSFASNATLARTLGILTGPIGLTVTSIWTVMDIASPAYRVTIPAVVQVAALRQQYLYGKQLALENRK